MTVTLTPSVRPTAFDFAFAAALACGWPPEPAFHACCTMLASGMSAGEAERLFRDAARRVQ
jgi:hypothetical protein